MTDFATQNLVNSGSAALSSFQEGSLRLQGLFLTPPRSSPYTLGSFSRLAAMSASEGIKSVILPSWNFS